MILIELFITFFKIGIFSFGGGYAMIPLIASEITSRGWLSEAEFIRIIGIAEMTPGPIAVNSATYVGYQTAGVIGAVSATLGIAAPSLIIILCISGFFFKNLKHPLMKRIFNGIMPVVGGLILAAALIVTRSTLFTEGVISLASMQISILVMVVILAVLIRRYKIHPILLIVIAAGMGVVSDWIV